MPLYEYICEDCGCPFQELVPAGEEQPSGLTCPVCCSPHVKRQLFPLTSRLNDGDFWSSLQTYEFGET